MTNKAKVSQEIADKIRLAVADYGTDGVIDTVRWHGTFKSLNDLMPSLLARALYVGCEIEPEFKVGDWVARLDGASFYPVGGVMVEEVLSVEKGRLGDLCVMHGDNGAWGTPFNHIRHATPEEINREKERRTWKEIGREVGEFHEGDVGIFRNGMKVSDLENLECYYENGDLLGFYPAESFVKLGECEEE